MKLRKCVNLQHRSWQGREVRLGYVSLGESPKEDLAGPKKPFEHVNDYSIQYILSYHGFYRAIGRLVQLVRTWC